jgi:dihydrofolate reductase
MVISLIAAMDRRGLIGDATGMPWHLPGDLRRFRTLTWGKPIVMGRRTFELIGKPLPGRFNIVLSRCPDFRAPGCPIVRTLDEALSVARDHLREIGGEEVMIIGGGKVYAEAIELWDRCYLTLVEGQFEGSTYFPVAELLRQNWRPATEPEAHPADEKNRFPYTFHVIERVRDAIHPTSQTPEGALSHASADPGKPAVELDLAAILTQGRA